MEETEDVIKDTYKTLTLVSEKDDLIENSSFIYNTQRDFVDSVLETNPDLQQDMIFLNSSWENMVQ